MYVAETIPYKNGSVCSKSYTAEGFILQRVRGNKEESFLKPLTRFFVFLYVVVGGLKSLQSGREWVESSGFRTDFLDHLGFLRTFRYRFLLPLLLGFLITSRLPVPKDCGLKARSA